LAGQASEQPVVFCDAIIAVSITKGSLLTGKDLSRWGLTPLMPEKSRQPGGYEQFS
jgi:hypothetical protein